MYSDKWGSDADWSPKPESIDVNNTETRCIIGQKKYKKYKKIDKLALTSFKLSLLLLEQNSMLV